MTFDQAQGMFRTHRTYETAYRYLAVASQRKAVKATNPDTFFNAVGEVASWLSASDEQLLAFEAAKTKATACLAHRAGAGKPTIGLVQSGDSGPATHHASLFQDFPQIYRASPTRSPLRVIALGVKSYDLRRRSEDQQLSSVDRRSLASASLQILMKLRS